MKRRWLIWILLLPVVLVAACRSEVPAAEETPALSITVEFPEFPAPTKADEGEVPASAAENAIYDLKIWVFNTITHDPVAQFETVTAADFPSGGGVRKYALPVSRAFSISKPKVDVFVMANTESVGSTLSASSTWGDLYSAVFGTDAYFSPASPIHAVPAHGLPMSGMSRNMTVSGEEPSLSIATVALSRAVSKLRYVFCQTQSDNSEESVNVEKIVLSGNQIPQNEYLFSESDYRIVSGDYVPTAMETLWPAGVTMASSEAPEAYSYAGQDGPTYENLINTAIAAGELTDCGTTYLRESDKALSGYIYYSVTKDDVTENKVMPFSMAAPGDFSRNHTWTLYGYFISNRTLQLAVSVLPWDKNNYTIRFDESSLQVTQKLTVDPTSATVVASGTKDHYNVYLDSHRAARAYLYVTTPQGGRLEIIPEGGATDLDAFTVTPLSAMIDPAHNSGRIDITIDRNPFFSGDPTGKTITLSFRAFTPDDREISGASECVDQIYHFIL